MDFNQRCVDCFDETGGEDICMHCGFSQSSALTYSNALKPGSVLNRYIIGRVLHVGDNSIIYKAFNENLAHIVVIKELFPEASCMAKRNEDGSVFIPNEYEGLFRRQANMLFSIPRFIRNVSNENIVNYLDEFSANNTVYQVMEYMEGLTLEEYFCQVERLSFEEALDIMMPIMEAFEALHMKGIILQSFSPRNVFMTTAGEVKLFGIDNLKLINEKEPALPDIIPCYSAPEVYAEGTSYIESDIYSLAAVWFKVLSGVEIPDGKRRLKDKRKISFQAFNGLDLKVPEHVEAAISKALSVKRDQRFSSVHDFVESLNGSGGDRKPKGRGLSTFLIIFFVLLFLAGSGAATAFWIMDHSIVPLKSATIELWYPDSGNKELNARWKLIEKNFEEYAESQRKVFPLKIDLVTKPVEASVYSKKLKNALQNGEGPDIYCSTDLTKDEYAYSLEDLYETILDTDMPDNQKTWEKSDAFKDMKALFAEDNKIAFAYDLPVLYVSKTSDSPTDPDDNAKLDTLITKQDIDDRRFKNPLICNPDAIVYGAYAYGYDGTKKTISVLEKLYGCANRDWDPSTFVKESIKYYLGLSSEYRLMFDQKSNLNVVKLTGANNKLGYIYPEVWSVNKNAEKKEIKAAEFLLYYLMTTTAGQNAISYVKTDVYYIPLTKNVPDGASLFDKNYKALVMSDYNNYCGKSSKYAKLHQTAVSVAKSAKKNDSSSVLKDIIS